MITFCTKCGNKNLNGAAKFCSKCGASFNSDTSKNLDLLNKNISEISETLFIIPQYFINDFEILLKKYDVRPKGILAINNPNESYLIVTQFMRNTKNVSYICIIGSWAEIPPYKIPNPTDSDQDKFMKSLGHIFKGVRPTFIDTGDKLVKGFTGDIKKGGQAVNLQDELLAMLSGIRIINVDVPRTMNYKITEYNRNIRSVTTAEKFFSLQNFESRGPETMAEEFKKIQDEAFKVNQDFYFILKDAETVGVSERDLRKLLRGRNISSSKARKLLKGDNIPYTAYDSRMKKRVKEAEKIAKERGEKIEKDYFYPKRMFRNIVREYGKKKLDQREGKTDLQKIEELMNLNQSSIPQRDTTVQTANIQTPPLPGMPMPKVQNVAQNVIPNTNLTRTETALLSPQEQLIKQRLRT